MCKRPALCGKLSLIFFGTWYCKNCANLTNAPISEDMFVDLVGTVGVENLGRHVNGSSWLLPDGRVAAELHDGTTWRHYLINNLA